MKMLRIKIGLSVLFLVFIGATVWVRYLSKDGESAKEDVTVCPVPFEDLSGSSVVKEYIEEAVERSVVAPPDVHRVPITLADIPAGIFRDQLHDLKPKSRQYAFKILSETGFLPNDAPSMRVDRGGGIYYVCSFGEKGLPSALAETVAGESLPSIVSQGASVPISSPPIRHSRPGSTKVLFLDFNGHEISGTAWEKDGVTSWDCRPFSRDVDETTFSDLEQSEIIQIWERVAEDFAPFDVDVTTEQPVPWTRTTGHALITPTIDKNGDVCPHFGWGGMAYLSVFGTANYSYNYSGSSVRSPAWVTDMSLATIAEATSHELGHNMGLSHDGSSSVEYYSGHFGDVIHWGPLMGTGYGRDVSQWCKGEYYDSNRSQDDLSIVAGRLAYRSDDYGDNNATAFALKVDPSGNISLGGVIETSNDPDVFYFSTGAGEIVIIASPYRASSGTWGGNLDIELKLFDSTGALVASDNPVDLVSASISKMVSAGEYYLHVVPVGVGDPMTSSPTGYTSYGSLGKYTLSGHVFSVFDTDGDSLPDWWEKQYFGGYTNAIASEDSDGDGADNLTEYVAGTVPTDEGSVFRIVSHSLPRVSGDPVVIAWDSVDGRTYNIQWDINLVYPLPVDISGDLPYPVNSYTDSVPRAGRIQFYRVGVRLGE